MEKVVYKSKVDAWLVIVVVAAVAVVLLPLFSGFSWGYLLAASGVLVCLVPVFALLFSIRYIVEGDKLTVSCGILGSRAYDIMSVCSIRPARTWLSSPAASLDRIELRFSVRRVQPLIISPEDKTGFIARLKSINPAIEILPAR